MKYSGKNFIGAARACALQIIEQVLKGDHVQEAMQTIPSRLSSKDIQLCSDLVYGYLRFKIRLEFILSQVLPKLDKLPEVMRIILAMGVYSLLFQDKIPDYAAINATVNHVKKYFGDCMAKVANAALRSIQRLEGNVFDEEWYASKLGDKMAGAFIFYGMPLAAGLLWREAYGDHSLNLLKRSAQRPWKSLRINPLHPKSLTLMEELPEKSRHMIRIGKYGFAFPPGVEIQKLCGENLSFWYDSGAFSWQSAGSIKVMEELGLFSWDKPVWDACAGSGIKGAALLERGVEVRIASDTSIKRSRNIHKFCERLHLPSPAVILANAAQPAIKEWDGHIIADVPCSGLGILARRPDIRAKITKKRFWLENANLQKNIIDSLIRILKKGRQIAYITCTLNPWENEKVIAHALERHSELELVKNWHTPHDHPWLEGMYGAVLIKKG